MNIIDLTNPSEYRMSFNDYQQLATRTANQGPDKLGQLCNWALGLAGESGEVVELIKKHVYHGKPLNQEDLKKELGDLIWYIANMAYTAGINFQDIADANIQKLKARYPEGFKLGGGIRQERPDTELIHDHKQENLASLLDNRI